jgi:diguanylate cyclase (GGDEF)-like protein
MDRQVSGAFIVALLNYVERAAGVIMAERVRRDAGCTKSMDELRASAWSSTDEVLAAASTASALLGEPDIGRRAGEEMYRMSVADKATRAFFLAAGSPAAALEGVLEYTVKMARGRTYRMVSSDQASCVIEGAYTDPKRGDPFFCGLSLGYWPSVATLFGAVGTAHHPSCQCRGDEVCTFVIQWDPGATAGDAASAAAADAELRRRIGTFERMQSVAEDLARASDLPDLAERLLDAVDVVSPAPQLLVAMKDPAGQAPILAWRGFQAHSARALGTRLLDGSYRGHPTITAMAPLGDFGIVAAIAPDGRAASPTSARLLEAFARHAVARIEAVLARQQADENRQTASGLLHLARALAETGTELAVSKCLARALPSLVGADQSSVMRWDAESGALRPVAFVGPPGQMPFREYSVKKVPGLFEVASHPTPFVLERATADPYTKQAMTKWDEAFDVIMPLIAQGEFLGFLCAGYQSSIPLDRDTVFARLQGAADLATTAFTNARLMEEIRHRALHDDLTGLPNRALLEDRARQSLLEAKRNGRRVGLLFLDLDRFKNVNDSMGHEYGDQLIQAASGRIRDTLRESDVFARTGGDEFVVVLHDIHDEQDATAVAAKVLEDLRRPFEIAGQALYISASIGVAVYPDDGEDLDVLLRAADSSMYAAKGAGRDTVIRRVAVDWSDEESPRLLLQTELHQAIDQGEITVFYQPQVAMADLRLTGAEALVRWNHPRLGLLSPDEFLPVARDSGLMPRLDQLVRHAAFEQARIWQQWLPAFTVSVNLSPESLGRIELLNEIAADIEYFGLAPEALEVELTEGLMTDELVPVVEGLSALGVRVAIDDFGTAGSVFSRFQALPVHTLKIDRSLVQASISGFDSTVLGTIVEMGHSLGMRVVAEGVESPVQAGHLRRARCDSGQGYLFGKPSLPEEIERLVCSQVANLEPPPGSRPHPPTDRNRNPR